MASSLDFVEYVVEQCSEAGEISYKKMFGEYGLYCNGKYFAAICDGRFLVKVTEAGKQLLPSWELAEPYEGGKPMLWVQNLEDRTFLKKLVEVTCAALPIPKPKKKKSPQS